METQALIVPQGYTQNVLECNLILSVIFEWCS